MLLYDLLYVAMFWAVLLYLIKLLIFDLLFNVW